MKKRTMKKWIPRNTDYCWDCKNMIFDKCRYTGQSISENLCLYDGCKCCCVGYPKEEE